MDCYETIDLMDDELAGRLAPGHRAGFDEHLDECVVCRTYLEQLRTTILALEHLPRPHGSGRLRAGLIERFKQEVRKTN